MARRSDHSKEELERLVVQATRRLVDELGVDGVTARKIADAVGYTPGTLYSHFANLTDIFLHVNAINLEELHEKVRLASLKIADPRQAVLEMGYAYLRYAQDQPNRFALMFTPQVPHGEDAPPHLQERVDALFELVAQQLRKLWPQMEEAVLELHVRTLWSGVHGLVSLSVRDQLFTRRWRADRHMLEQLVARYLAD